MMVIEARPRQLGEYTVGRVLPHARRRLVGPFIFFDHMGPEDVVAGKANDILPHPHIGLATVTYLFEGALMHRDSLGSQRRIEAGAINWMTAGRGICHSERTPEDLRKVTYRIHGLQVWVALPLEAEEAPPEFHHHPAASLPMVERPGAAVRVLVGEAYGVRSPVKTYSPTFYVDAVLDPGASLALPDFPERAAYLVDERRMHVFEPGDDAVIHGPTRAILLGGDPLEGPRHIWWNFVSSRRERIEQAKDDWKHQRFPEIPGDDEEFIPLPED